MAGKWRCWFRRPCSPSSIFRPFATVLPTGRCASLNFRALKPPGKSQLRAARSQRAGSTLRVADMNDIGFQLYSEMLKDAVEALKDGREPDLAMPLAASAEINLHAPALLPA